MQAAGSKTLSIGEWVAGIGAVALAVAIPKFAGISQKWANTIVFTVLVFSGVVIVLRPAWGRRAFWSSLIAVFLFHCIVLAEVEQSLPPTSEGPHGLPLISAGVVEGVFILGVLWRKSMRSTRL
jgi:hypothetical protein